METILKTAFRTLCLPLDPSGVLYLNWDKAGCTTPDSSVGYASFQVQYAPFLWRPHVFLAPLVAYYPKRDRDLITDCVCETILARQKMFWVDRDTRQEFLADAKNSYLYMLI